MVVWERPEPPRRETPTPLSRELIARAAMRIADSDGLEAVSLRAVASALDAGPIRLYRYFESREELLDLMVDAVYGQIRPPEPAGGDWRGAVGALARGVRRAALRHEWFTDLLGGRPHLGPAALGHMEATLAALRRGPGLGGDPDCLMRAATAVNAYVLGAIGREVAELRAERESGLSEHQWQVAAGPYLTRMLATGRYPTLADVLARASDPTPDTEFATGLNMLLAGITADRA